MWRRIGARSTNIRSISVNPAIDRARRGDERVGADVDRQPEAVARRIGEAALEVLGGRERDRVHEHVEALGPEALDLAEDAGDVVVRAHVAGRYERRAHRACELADVPFDPLPLV